jgi:hypothetical protein
MMSNSDKRRVGRPKLSDSEKYTGRNMYIPLALEGLVNAIKKLFRENRLDATTSQEIINQLSSNGIDKKNS